MPEPSGSFFISYLCSAERVEESWIGLFEKMADGMNTWLFETLFWRNSIGPLNEFRFRMMAED